MRKHYGCGLQYVNWLRVVLDEAHKIRSRKTRMFKACNALVSKSRWCLSGTPVQNRLDDLYSLFCFLKLQPNGTLDIDRSAIMCIAKTVKIRDKQWLIPVCAVCNSISEMKTNNETETETEESKEDDSDSPKKKKEKIQKIPTAQGSEFD